MSKTSEEGNTRWDQIMGNFDLLFAQINDLGLIQQELKTQVTAAQEEQKKIAKQVQANGQTVASLTIRQMEKEKLEDSSDNASVVSAEETVLIMCLLPRLMTTSQAHPRGPMAIPTKNSYPTI